MPDVIHLLEQVGQDATLRTVDLSRLLAAARISPGVREALEQGDRRSLESLLGARANVFCGQHPAEDDEEEEDDQQPDEDDDEERRPSALRTGAYL